MGSVLTRRRGLGTRLCTRSRTSRSSRRSGARPRASVSRDRPRALRVRTRGRNAGSAPPSPPWPSCCRPRPGRSRVSTPRSTTRWRSRSVRTRVLPDPAGAITRAGPAPWVTAASWSGARSAAGAAGGGTTVEPPEGHRLDVDDDRVARPVGSRGPGRAARRRPTPAGRRASTTSPAAVGRSGPGAEPLGLAAPPPDRVARGAGVVVVGPDEEVQAVEPGLEGGPDGPRLDRPRLGLPEPGRDRRPAPPPPAGGRPTPRAARPTHGAGLGQGGLVDDHHRRPRPRRRDLAVGHRPRPLVRGQGVRGRPRADPTQPLRQSRPSVDTRPPARWPRRPAVDLLRSP